MRTPFIWFLWGRRSSVEVMPYNIIGLSWCNTSLSWCNKSLSWCNKSSIFEILYNFGVKAACCIVNSTQLQQRDELLMCEPVYMEDWPHQLTIAGCYQLDHVRSRISMMININSALRVCKCPLAQLVERQTVNSIYEILEVRTSNPLWASNNFD